MTYPLRKLAAVAMLSLASLASAEAATTPIRDLTPANTLAANDDESTDSVALGFSANFFGFSGSSVYVNNNGNVTFDSASGTYTPLGLADVGQPIIAPFFADVDTRYYGSPVTYGTTTIGANAAFVVNWLDVGYFSGATAGLTTNSFQLVLIDQGNGDFDIEFNYGTIAWETGTAESSGGDANGLGGTSAFVGFSNGTLTNQFAGSGTPGAFLNAGPQSLVANSNVGLAGRYLFTVRNGEITNPPSTVPVPASLPLLLVGPAILGALRLRKARHKA